MSFRASIISAMIVGAFTTGILVLELGVGMGMLVAVICVVLTVLTILVVDRT